MCSFGFLSSKEQNIIKQVIELGDKNKRTLGLIPRTAFIEMCNKGHIFACFEDGKLVGYILFWPRIRSSICTINHVCVQENKRHQGIAKKLLKEFLNIFSGYQQIRLSCRNDYLLNRFWQSLGFSIYNYANGKDTERYSILYKYTYHTSKDLLEIIDDKDERLNVLLDDSMVFDINTQTAFDNLNNSIFTLSSDVKYWIAPVLHDDFAKQKDKDVKQKPLEQIKLFPTLPINKIKERELYQEIQACYDYLMQSDIRQICSAIANQIHIFVTNDRQILNLSTDLIKRFDLRVFSLGEFYKISIIC